VRPAEEVLAQQQKLMLMQREFISMVSHEFRNPLATMQGVIYLMQNAPEADAEKRRRWLGMIRDAVNNLCHIADRVLELNRLDGAMQPASCTALAIAPFVREFTATLGDLHGHTRVIAEIQPGVPQTVWVNTPLLRTVLDHLIANALKFSPADTTVRLRVAPHEGSVRVCVVDQGPGIEAKELQRLWEPFFRSGQAQPGSGIGLGLTIARRAAEAMGAKVGVESSSGSGSTFWVQLPAVQT
jgi:signal transduction histidine kinase